MIIVSMGSCMSLKLASSSSNTITRSSTNNKSLISSKYGKIIRVVHLNGWMEEFEDGITVGEVTGGDKQGKHFVFAQAQLASLLDSKPLDSATQLEMGNVYFLLPHSIFKTEMSPIDLATISKRLTLAAATQKSVRAGPSEAGAVKPAPADLSSAGAKKKKKKNKVKRNRYADRYVPPRINNTVSDGRSRVAVGGDVDINNNNHLFDYDDYNNENSLVVMKQKQQQLGGQSPCSWKPILESITERSLTRDESDNRYFSL